MDNKYNNNIPFKHFLSQYEQQILSIILQSGTDWIEFTNIDIAARIGCSPFTTHRIVKRFIRFGLIEARVVNAGHQRTKVRQIRWKGDAI